MKKVALDKAGWHQWCSGCGEWVHVDNHTLDELCDDCQNTFDRSLEDPGKGY